MSKVLITNEQIKQITEEIISDFVCYVNVDTGEHVSFFKETLETFDFEDDGEEMSMFSETDRLTYEDFKKKESWEHCVEIEPMDSFFGFRVMEDFVNQYIPAKEPVKAKLFEALSHKKPFANFNYWINQSNYLKDWFDFRFQKNQLEVRNQLSLAGALLEVEEA